MQNWLEWNTFAAYDLDLNSNYSYILNLKIAFIEKTFYLKRKKNFYCLFVFMSNCVSFFLTRMQRYRFRFDEMRWAEMLTFRRNWVEKLEINSLTSLIKLTKNSNISQRQRMYTWKRPFSVSCSIAPNYIQWIIQFSQRIFNELMHVVWYEIELNPMRQMQYCENGEINTSTRPTNTTIEYKLLWP